MSTEEEIPLKDLIASLRQRILEGEDLSINEMKQAIVYLRQGREAAAAPKPAKSAKKQAASISSDDLLSQLGDL